MCYIKKKKKEWKLGPWCICLLTQSPALSEAIHFLYFKSMKIHCIICKGTCSVPTYSNMLPFKHCVYFFFIMTRLVCLYTRNISMALPMISPRILILQILVIFLSIELEVGRRPHAQHCQLGLSQQQTQQD